ncbi:CBS domain-containing protein [Psychrobium sp. 1_MG-2023]|uniref:CBS domain-containing protein n=1 Tax=Psychrobium sp. 1_MG-2023 TaxID=3062624 RepID=UPI000C328E8B|nr:CBS domain-containing protein [Psychrobium sp. 1_MG-2023]MDP2562611.1 CBS domain-containing protein [Psychrobium sp. 1_MG-2023]PKF54368.1 hypothetical protein CW748_16070 [Alteromonadales bacterium alter-6D02]
MMIDLKVKDFMTHQPPQITSTALLADAVSTIESSDQDSAVVVDDNQVVGILSERDCLKTLISNSYYCDGAPHVSEFMKTSIKTVESEDNILDLANNVVNGTSGFCDQTCFPVMQHGVFVGLIGVKGLVEALNKYYKSCLHKATS